MSSKSKLSKASLLGLGMFLGLLALLMAVFWASSTPLLIKQAQAQVNQPVIELVSPTSGDDNVETPITIRGSGFAEPLVVTLDNGSESQVLTVEYFDSAQINAVVPAGMSVGVYDLTVSSVGVEVVEPDAFEVTAHPVNRDLRSDATWLWSEPHPLRVGIQNSGVGLLVQHVFSRETVDQVTVEFRLDSPTGTLLGRSQTNALAPLAIESTAKVVWEPQTAGEYTVCAIIDPDNDVEEEDEENNTVCRPVTVLPPTQDVTPPEVDHFIIQDGAASTPQITVTLDITATEYGNPTPSGLYQVKFIEFEYSQQALRWVEVNESEWLDYETSRIDHLWTLTSTFGTRYMQAWVADNEQNISAEPGVDIISLPPQEVDTFIAQHGVHSYRILLSQGDIFTATLTPSSGDPDLYVWGTSGVLVGQSQNFFLEPDVVSFEAPNDGTYQIEVHGYQDSNYRLSFGTATNLVQAVPQRPFALTSGKSPPETPNVPVNTVPPAQAAPAPPPPPPIPDPDPQASSYTIYLPISVR